MEVLVLSDTHIPERVPDIPPSLKEALGKAGFVIHCGDFVSPEAYDRIRGLVRGKFFAVYGNMDYPRLRAALPEKRVIDVGGVKIGVAHGWGAPDGLAERIVKRLFPEGDIDVLVFGHSHRPFKGKVKAGKKEIFAFNPGAVAAFPFYHINSYGIIRLEGGSYEFEIVPV